MKDYRVKPGHALDWKDVDPGDTGPFNTKDDALKETEKLIEKLDVYQERLYAEAKHGLLIVLQAMDTAGKDGTIRHVMRGINPQGCRVTSFKVPTPEESAHDFLWRVHPHVPAKGYIAIFNRSHYEDVLVTRAHKLISRKEARRRFEEINDFEKILRRNGTTILKFHLVISKAEQKQRLEKRLEDPQRYWKFSLTDLKERRYWGRYRQAYAEALSATSTPHAPWYLIPANHKWYRNYLVARIIASTLKDLHPHYPPAPRGVNFHKLKIPS